MMSYWENDSLHQEMSRLNGRKSILVSGCGDGGLTDALRLVLRDFDHAKFIKRFSTDLDVKSSLAKTLLEIDSAWCHMLMIRKRAILWRSMTDWPYQAVWKRSFRITVLIQQ